MCFLLQLAALECADEANGEAARIGAANTLVRQSGGGLKAFNTDASAAISAVEAALRGAASPFETPYKGTPLFTQSRDDREAYVDYASAVTCDAGLGDAPTDDQEVPVEHPSILFIFIVRKRPEQAE